MSALEIQLHLIEVDKENCTELDEWFSNVKFTLAYSALKMAIEKVNQNKEPLKGPNPAQT